MPESSHSPLTPAPVPTSTTALAPVTLASTLSSAPTAGVTAPAPMSTARSRAAATMASSVIDCSACATIDSARLGRGPGAGSSVLAMPAA